MKIEIEEYEKEYFALQRALDFYAAHLKTHQGVIRWYRANDEVELAYQNELEAIEKIQRKL